MTRTVQDLIRELGPRCALYAWTHLATTSDGSPVMHRAYLVKSELRHDLSRLPPGMSVHFTIEEWNFKLSDRWHRGRRVTIGMNDPDKIEERLAHYG